MAYQAEKTLRDATSVDAALRSKVETQIKAVRDAIESDDGPRMESAVAALEGAMHELAAAMYASSQPESGQAGPAPSGSGETDGGDDVVEGEFRET